MLHRQGIHRCESSYAYLWEVGMGLRVGQSCSYDKSACIPGLMLGGYLVLKSRFWGKSELRRC